MKQNKWFKVVVIVGSLLVLLYAGVFVVDTPTSEELQEANENITSYPGPDTPWYAVGAMPVFVFGVPLAVLLAVLAWAVNITRLRRYGGE